MEQNTTIQTIKNVIKKRRNINYIIGVISFLFALLSLAIAQNFESYIASVVILSVAGSLIILISFCSVSSFELDTYITVFLGYFISFSMICIVPLDAALTTSSKNKNQSKELVENDSDNFKRYWIVMYWTIFFISNLIYQLQQLFHNNGYIRFSQKIKSAFLQFLRMFAVGIGIFVVLSLICLFWLKIKGFNNILAVVLVISNAYGISILAFLFGYGLIKLPFYLWNKSQREENLKELLQKSHKLFKQYQASYWKLQDISIASQRIQRRIQNVPQYSSYLERLQKETPDYLNPIGYRFSKNILYTPDNQNKWKGKIDLRRIKFTKVLAQIRHEIKIRNFQYERQIQKWKRVNQKQEFSSLNDYLYTKIKVYQSVFLLITEESLDEIDRKLSGVSQRSSFKSNEKSKSQSKIDYSKVKPVKVKAKELHKLLNIGYKIFAIILALYSILIIFCEATLVFGSPNKALAFYQMIKDVTNVPGIIILILTVLFYVILCTYFALGKLKIFGSFELFPYFTHRDTLIQNASTCLFLTFPLCYNIMLLFGIIDKNTKDDGKHYQSGFDKFYDPMKEIPFFGHYYNVIVCLLIVFVSIAFSFKKTQELIQKISKNKIKFTTLIEDDLMLKGELYILQEWQRLKDEKQQQELQKQELQKQEIYDTTEEILPPEKQLESFDSLPSRQSSESNEPELSQETNQTQIQSQQNSESNIGFMRKISNFFKKLGSSKSSSQQSTTEQSNDNVQQIQLDKQNSNISLQQQVSIQSSDESQQEQSVNISIASEEDSSKINKNLKEKLTKK